MPIPFYRPAPAPEGLFGDKIMPRAGASPISAFLFQWVTPLLKAGYSRPLNENGNRALCLCPTPTDGQTFGSSATNSNAERY